MKPNYTFNAEVTRVLDGDTIECRVQLWVGLYQDITVRMVGINSPEIHSTNAAEKKAGAASQMALMALLGAHGTAAGPVAFLYPITVKICDLEKYGRALGEIFLPNERFQPGDLPTNRTTADKMHSVNEWMVFRGYAKPYDGGKRALVGGNPFARIEPGTPGFAAGS